MTQATASPMRSLPFGVFSLTAALTLLTFIAFYVSRNSSVGEALFGLPSSQRSALYARTLETLRVTCAHATESDLREFCQEQARLIARFPECDADCQALSRRFSPRPTK
jgi:hypothetical protein